MFCHISVLYINNIIFFLSQWLILIFKISIVLIEELFFHFLFNIEFYTFYDNRVVSHSF